MESPYTVPTEAEGGSGFSIFLLVVLLLEFFGIEIEPSIPAGASGSLTELLLIALSALDQVVPQLFLSLFPVYSIATRVLATIGITAVLVGVTTNAVIANPPFWRSTVAVTMVFLSWDAAERAIRLGEQVGGAAASAAVEVAGVTATTIVAGIAILVTIAVSQLSIGSQSPAGLALLLVSTVAFVLAHVPEPPDSRN